MPVQIEPLRRYRITRGISVVLRNGHYVQVTHPHTDELNALQEGTDYFIGGHVYTVTDETAAALQADGFEVT